jgi:hypothetical protein
MVFLRLFRVFLGVFRVFLGYFGLFFLGILGYFGI